MVLFCSCDALEGILYKIVRCATTTERSIVNVVYTTTASSSSPCLMTEPHQLPVASSPLFALEISQDLLTLCARRLDVTDHVESTFWQIITLAVDDSLETPDGVLQIHKLALDTSEDLSDSERLRQESLQLTSTPTVSLSASDNSSIPRMAMISWSD